MRLRVATYNIHKGVARDLFGLRRSATIHEMRERLHDLSADLVFLQEVLGRNDRHAGRFEKWPAERQDQFLARSPSLKHAFQTAYGRNANYLHGHHGNALLSRWPILREDNRDVSDHVLEKRGVLHCEVDCEGTVVHCFVIHFGLFGRSRDRQAEVLIDWILKAVPEDAPLLIAGDFNDWRDRLSDRFYERLGVREVFDVARPPLIRTALHFVRARIPGADVAARSVPIRVPLRAEPLKFALPGAIRPARTYPSLLPWLPMDRIYQRGFTVHAARVLRGPTWAKLSDHAPLVADLELLPRAQRAKDVQPGGFAHHARQAVPALVERRPLPMGRRLARGVPPRLRGAGSPVASGQPDEEL